MAKEIERKFLLTKVPLKTDGPGDLIAQGYLSVENEEIRIRSKIVCPKEKDDKSSKFFLTCKGSGDLSREEWETEIPKWVFDALWKKTEGRVISKIRCTMTLPGGLKAEIDDYFQKLNGLVTLEVEFPDEETANKFTLPEEIEGRDVTFDKRYKNKNLALNGLPK